MRTRSRSRTATTSPWRTFRPLLPSVAPLTDTFPAPRSSRPSPPLPTNPANLSSWPNPIYSPVIATVFTN